MNNTYYKILNEIAAAFDMDQWDERVNLFTDVINRQLNIFVHNTKYDCIYILENWDPSHDFPQFDFYKERCYVNGEKVELNDRGSTKNKWKDRKTVNVTIEDLNQLGKSCRFMFFRCHSLVLVPLFDISKVTDVQEMFAWCRSLEVVPLFDTNRVTNMNNMFCGCEFLKSVPKFNTSRVSNMECMFYGCDSLESVPLFDTNGVTDMKAMFYACPSLSEKTKKAWRSVYSFKKHEIK